MPSIIEDPPSDEIVDQAGISSAAPTTPSAPSSLLKILSKAQEGASTSATKKRSAKKKKATVSPESETKAKKTTSQKAPTEKPKSVTAFFGPGETAGAAIFAPTSKLAADKPPQSLTVDEMEVDEQVGVVDKNDGEKSFEATLADEPVAVSAGVKRKTPSAPITEEKSEASSSSPAKKKRAPAKPKTPLILDEAKIALYESMIDGYLKEASEIKSCLTADHLKAVIVTATNTAAGESETAAGEPETAPAVGAAATTTTEATTESSNTETEIASTPSITTNPLTPHLSSLALLLESSPLPLASLTEACSEHIASLGVHGVSTSDVRKQILMLGDRKPNGPKGRNSDPLTDQDPKSLHRFEILTDLLPQFFTVKKSVILEVRMSIKKIGALVKAVERFLSMLRKGDKIDKEKVEAEEKKLSGLIAKDKEGKDIKAKKEAERLEKLRIVEEKKEAERKRKQLQDQLKSSTAAQKEAEKAKKEAEKAKKEAEKAKKEEMAKAKKEETVKKKEASAKKKEEAAKMKEEKEAAKKEEERKKAAAVKKQSNMLMGFFGKAKSPETKYSSVTSSNESKTKNDSLRTEVANSKFASNGMSKITATNTSSINAAASSPATKKFNRMSDPPPSTFSESSSSSFWSSLDSSDTHSAFQSPSLPTRGTGKFESINVMVTVFTGSGFQQRAYSESKQVSIWNRRKFLAFHEDERPPYEGSFSKRCNKLVNGRNPFGKDTKNLDYDYDSEAEWEEGEEEGEDLGDNEDDDVEEDKKEAGDRAYDYGDGWMAADDDLGLDDDDEEARALRNIANKTEEVEKVVVVCRFGGIPPLPQDLKLLSCQAVRLKDCPKINLSVDKPVKVKVKAMKEKTNGSGSGKSTQAISSTLLPEFIRYVHNNIMTSKDKLLEGFMKREWAEDEEKPSKAQVMKKIDEIAFKKRLNSGGSIWRVKAAVQVEVLGSELPDVGGDVQANVEPKAMSKFLKDSDGKKVDVFAGSKKVSPKKKSAEKGSEKEKGKERYEQLYENVEIDLDDLF